MGTLVQLCFPLMDVEMTTWKRWLSNQIWRSIYSTNFIESLNKEIKRQTKKKILFPNEEALERYLVTLFEDYNFKQSQRIHKGFGQCSDTLESLFD